MNNRGQTTLIIVIFLGIIALIIIAAFGTTISYLKISHNTIQGLKAYQAAEAGVERVLAEWIEDPTPVAEVLYEDIPVYSPDSEELGTYSVTIFDLGNGQWQIDSTGQSGLSHRKIEAKVEVSLGGPHFAFSKAIYSGSNLDMDNAEDTKIWGDVYVNGIVQNWDDGDLYATDDDGTHFSPEPIDPEVAPWGKLEYYYSGSADDMDIDGDVSLNTLHNPSGDPVQNTDHPTTMPVVGSGSYSNFAGYYNLNAPISTKYDNLVIYEESTLTTLNLANGKNTDIIGEEANANGYATEFTWIGQAIRDNDSTYVGDLIFAEDFILYIDGDVDIDADVSGNSLSIIASGAIDIDADTLPSQNFNLIAHEDLDISTTATLNGVYYSYDDLTLSDNPDINGGLIANEIILEGGAYDITYVQDNILKIATWLPGSALSTVRLVSWNEVAP